MNKEDFVTYEQAIALKKLGFKEKCLYHYNTLGIINPNYFNENTNYIIDTNTLYDVYNNKQDSYEEHTICDAPTLSQAQKWLNKNKNLKLFVVPSNSSRLPYSYIVFNTTKTIYKNSPIYYSSYEEALSAGISECINILTY